MELWRKIIGFETYFISTQGRVFNTKTKHFRKPQKINKGYRFVRLGKKNLTIHRLVAQAFLPNPNNYPQVGHKDSVPHNNHIGNLEWCNQSMNEAVKIKTGKPTHRKLTPQQVLDITTMYAKDAPIKEIEQKFNIDRSRVLRIVQGKYFKEIPRELFSGRRNGLTQEEIKKIIFLRSKGLLYREISKITGRGISSIARVVTSQGV